MVQDLTYSFQPKTYDQRDAQGRINPAAKMTVMYEFNHHGLEVVYNVADIIRNLGFEAEVTSGPVRDVTGKEFYKLKTGYVPADLAEDLSDVFLTPSLDKNKNPYKGHSTELRSYPPGPYRSPLVEKAKAFLTRFQL